MDMWTLLILLVIGATLVSLASGVLSMVVDHELAHTDSAHWMALRVGFQALAVVMVLLALPK